jgi:hypothetical protein
MPKDIKEVKAVENIKCVALGEDLAEIEMVKVINEQPQSTEEKVVMLETRIFDLGNALASMFAMVKALQDDRNAERNNKLAGIIEAKKKDNKIEIPEGTILTGKTKGLSYFLHVKDGGFYVGITRYDSLSAAAIGVSGVRRSGWTFWTLPDGKTVKEVFKG